MINKKNIAIIASIGILVVLLFTFKTTIFQQKVSMSVEQELINLGTIHRGGDGSATFKLKNTGDADLSIEAITPDCHCTVVENFQKKIHPGEIYPLRLKYDTKIPGYFNSVVSLKTNADKPDRVLIIRGFVQ